MLNSGQLEDVERCLLTPELYANCPDNAPEKRAVVNGNVAEKGLWKEAGPGARR